jgi:hypothetical protein
MVTGSLVLSVGCLLVGWVDLGTSQFPARASRGPAIGTAGSLGIGPSSLPGLPAAPSPYAPGTLGSSGLGTSAGPGLNPAFAPASAWSGNPFTSTLPLSAGALPAGPTLDRPVLPAGPTGRLGGLDRTAGLPGPAGPTAAHHYNPAFGPYTPAASHWTAPKPALALPSAPPAMSAKPFSNYTPPARVRTNFDIPRFGRNY